MSNGEVIWQVRSGKTPLFLKSSMPKGSFTLAITSYIFSNGPLQGLYISVSAKMQLFMAGLDEHLNVALKNPSLSIRIYCLKLLFGSKEMGMTSLVHLGMYKVRTGKIGNGSRRALWRNGETQK